MLRVDNGPNALTALVSGFLLPWFVGVGVPVAMAAPGGVAVGVLEVERAV